MKELLNLFWELFINSTRLTEEVAPYLDWGNICVIVICVLACIFGFFVYRAYFSALVFMGISIVLCSALSAMPWGQVAAWCAVLGVVMALLAYRWHHIGGFCICILVGACIGWNIYPSVVLSVGIGLLFGLLELYFPVIAIIASTSLWGSWMLVEGFQLQIVWKIVMIGLVTVVCFILQMMMSRKQKLFTMPIPQKMRYWLKKREQ